MKLTKTREQVIKAHTKKVLAKGRDLLEHNPWTRRDRKDVTDIPEDGGTIHLSKRVATALTKAGLIEQNGDFRGPCDRDRYFQLSDKGFTQGRKLLGAKNLDLSAALAHILDLAYFHPDDRCDGEVAIPSLWVPGGEGARLVLVVGPNAGGKSFFRRLWTAVTSPGKKSRPMEPGYPPGPFPVAETIPLSMQGRTANGMFASMVYGSEDYHSTGENSSHLTTKGIQTAFGRRHDVAVYWDEPDIGMSGGPAAGIGVMIREAVNTAPDHVQAVFVTTHSPTMAAQLAKTEPRPHYVHLGAADAPGSLEEWIEEQRDPEPVSPEQLQKQAQARFRLIQRILNSKGE